MIEFGVMIATCVVNVLDVRSVDREVNYYPGYRNVLTARSMSVEIKIIC
jgi:hypothetical protein